MSVQRNQKKMRHALMRQSWSHQRIIDEKQGSSKEIGYQLKGDLSHMYRFVIRQTMKIYIRKETYTYEMVREKKNKVSKRKS